MAEEDQRIIFSERFQLEIRINRLPKRMYSLFNDVFAVEGHMEDVFVLSTFQHSTFDLSGIGVEINDEKDKLLENVCVLLWVIVSSIPKLTSIFVLLVFQLGK